MPRSAGLLTIMGSGETGPSMVAVHRRVFERFDEPPVVAVIDSAYGFQENADELSAKAVDYFQTSFPGVRAEVASLRRWDLPAGERERALEVIRSAEVVFAGPGSPSYALRVWEGLDMGGLLRAALDRGAVTVASAAAVTVGRHALPVYEIYKAGDDPSWLPGLDLLSAIGIETAVVPHFDNAEGGTHDTRFCWMGARRFAVLRGLLPAETVVLGIDEHSAALIDVLAGTLEAAGKGGVTILIGEHETVVSSGETIGLDRLAATGSPSAGPAHAPAGEGDAEDVARFAEAFGEALDRGAVEPALDAILELEDAHEAWHDRAEEAHRALRGMVTRLGSVLTRQADIEDARIEAVHLLVDLRERARADGRWDDADALRTVLAVLGIEVRDTPSGPEWDDRRG